MIPSSSTPAMLVEAGFAADQTQRTCVEGVVDLEYTQGEVDHIGDLGDEALNVRAQRSLWAHRCSQSCGRFRAVPVEANDERITGAGVERDV